MATLKEVTVYVEKHPDGTYWGTTQNLQGVVSSFGNTLTELKENMQEAFNDQLELAKELKEDWANDYENVTFNYKLDLQGFFELVKEINLSKIAEKANVNRSLLQRYKKGETCSEEQAKKIELAVHKLGEELLSVSF